LSLLIDRVAGKKAKSILVFLGEKNERAMRLLKEIACKKGLREVSFAVHKNPVKDLESIRNLAPDAVLCENDFHARSILDSMAEKPGFLISGYGATPTAVDIFPRLTTVNPDFASAGMMAFEYLSGKEPCDNNIINLKPYLLDGDTL
jgi:DNA-binding LacI/PurR family transcriptional regulator